MGILLGAAAETSAGGGGSDMAEVECQGFTHCAAVPLTRLKTKVFRPMTLFIWFIAFYLISIYKYFFLPLIYNEDE